jgi:hypothetical protein
MGAVEPDLGLRRRERDERSGANGVHFAALIDKTAGCFYRRLRRWAPRELVGSGLPASDMPRHLAIMLELAEENYN